MKARRRSNTHKRLFLVNNDNIKEGFKKDQIELEELKKAKADTKKMQSVPLLKIKINNINRLLRTGYDPELHQISKSFIPIEFDDNK